MKKKVENFFRRLLSMLLSLCMLVGNVGSMGIALADTSLVSESTGPLFDYVDYQDQKISTTLNLTYVGASDYMFENGSYTDYADVMAWYYVDVSVTQYVASIDVTLDSSTSLDGTGNPAVFLFRGNDAGSIDMENGLGSWQGYTLTATKNGNSVELHAQNGNPGWNMPTGYFRFFVGIPMANDTVVDMLNNGASTVHTVGNLRVNNVPAANNQTRSNTVTFNPQVTKTAKSVNGNGNNYVRWELHYTNNLKLHNTIVTDTVTNGTFVRDWKQQIGNENAIQAYEGSYLISGGQTVSDDGRTITFNVTGTNEESGYTELRDKYTTDMKLVYFTQTDRDNYGNPMGGDKVVSTYSVTPNGIPGTEIKGLMNVNGQMKEVTIRMQRVENNGEPTPVINQDPNAKIRVIMANADFTSRVQITTEAQPTGNPGEYKAAVNFDADHPYVWVTVEHQNHNRDNVFTDGGSMYINANNNGNHLNREDVDLFEVAVEDNGSEAVVTLTNKITVARVNVVLKQKDAVTGEESNAAVTGKLPELFAVYMDAEGNPLSKVVKLDAINQNGEASYSGMLSPVFPEGTESTEGRVVLLTWQGHGDADLQNNPNFTADRFKVYDGLTPETSVINLNVDGKPGISAYDIFNMSSEVDEADGSTQIKLLNEVEVKHITVKVESYDESTGQYSAVKPYNANDPNLYLAYMDAEGNPLGTVCKLTSTGDGVYTADIPLNVGTEAFLNVLTLKNGKKYHEEYKPDDYERYYQDKLTNTSIYIETTGPDQYSSYNVSMDEYFGLTITEDENGVLVHLVNDRAAALQGLVDAYNGGDLIINEETGSFTNFEGGKYFNASSPIGIAGSFHLVAFEEAHLDAHTNGNVLANKLYANNNFGTNGYPFELTYVVDYVKVHTTSASSEDHILALGAGNQLAVSENGGSLNVGVNGERLSKPKNVIIDKDAAHPFIDLGAVESEVRGMSSTLASNETVGISEDFNGQYKRLKLTSTTGAGYYNMSAEALMRMGEDLRLDFTDQNSGTIVINVDCSGTNHIVMPQRALVNINGQDQGTGEVTTFENGKVIWNFVGCEGKTIDAYQMTGMIIAPGATVNLRSNVNGTVIADYIYVKAESHRTDFTGTVTPASGAFSAVKKVNGKTPSSDEKFWFVLEELTGENTWTEVQRVQNSGSKIQFSNITYTQAGTHTYRIRELDLNVPDGYTISGETYYMQVEVYASSVLGNTALGKKYTFWKENQSLPNNESFVFNNSKDTVDFTLIKKDSDEDIFLEGAVFELTRPDGSKTAVTTNNSGRASFMNMQDGTYTLTEISAPSGYVMPNPNSWSFNKSGSNFNLNGNFSNASISGAEMTVLNEEEQKLDISGSKTWNDNNNYNQNRPQSITVILYANSVERARVTADQSNGWSWNFPNLDAKDANGNTITYTIGEVSVPGYTSRVDGYNIINTEETTEVSGHKIWVGDESAAIHDLTRPTSVTIRVWDGNTQKAVVNATAANGWNYSVTGLPKYRNGQLITYTVTEDAVPGYSSTVTGYNVTNTLQTTTLEGEKIWDDQNNAYGLRPSYITVNLLKTVNGTTTQVDSHTVSSSDQWKWRFVGLHTKELVGGTLQDVTYSVQEVSVPGYTTTTEGNNIKNTLKTVDINGSKTWSDNNNSFGTRPEQITVVLKQNNIQFKTATVKADENGDWKFSFVDLPAEDASGNPYVYTVAENVVTGYEASYDQTNYVINNTLITKNIGGVKAWDDQEDFYGLRPESVTIKASYNGVEYGTATATAADGWVWSINNLPKFDKNTGSEIVYLVEETPSAGYVAVIDGNSVENRLITVDLQGTKNWEGDETYAELTRPEYIVVKAMANGAVVKSVDVYPVDGKWDWSIDDLPKYDENGTEVVYTVVEEPVPGYSTTGPVYNEETGKYSFTNTLLSTDISVEKVWTDLNNKDNTRPASVTVQLTANGKNFGSAVTLSDEAGWNYTWNDLPQVDTKGASISYNVAEIDVPEGYVSVKSGNVANGFTFNNIYVFDTEIVLEAEKVLNGATLTEGMFTFELKQGDALVEQVVNAANGAVVFEKITYTKDDLGTHTYTITEVNSGVNGFEYSDDVYTVEVTVAQDATTRQLSATAVYKKNGEVVTDAVFVNNYDATDANIAIPYSKTLSNGENNTEARSFTFVLVLPDGSTQTKTLNVAAGATRASGSFDVLTYNQVGEYEYTVYEVAGTEGDIVYDATRYTVKVTVVDNGGQLEAAITSITAGGAANNAVAFTNTYVAPVSADLEAKKILNGPNALEAGQFTFLLKQGDTELQTRTNDANGVVDFDPINYGAAGVFNYTISEVAGNVGGYDYDETVYNVTVTVSQDSVTKQLSTSVVYTNLTDGTTVPTFVNTYAPAPASLTIPVEKHFDFAEGLTPPDIHGKFTFTITGSILSGNATSVPLPSQVAITNQSDIVYFSAINFTDAGTYKYQIAETGNVPGVTNDTTGVKTVTIVVTDDMNGNLVAAFAEGSATKVEFTNTYDVDEVKFSIPVKKVLSVPEGMTGADIARKFTFTLATTNGAPMPAATMIANPDANGGTASFGEITYTEPGEYVYTITETVTGGGEVPGVTNDTENVKQVVVKVEDTSNGILVIANSTSTDENPVTFTNIYNANPATVSIPVTKILQWGEGLQNPGIANAFNFTISGEVTDGVATVAPLPAVVSQTNPDADGGDMTFGPISFDKVGTYVYTITESGSQDGVTAVSAKQVEATVVVTDDGLGNLVAELKDYSTEEPITFTNEYTVEPTTAEIPVQKVLTVLNGEGPGDVTGLFTFELGTTNSAPMPVDEEGNTVTSLTNASEGEVATFGTFTFTKPGEYYYSITETGTVPGVDNDTTSVRYVTIDVDDLGNGKLSAEVLLGDAEAVVFTNTYSAEPAIFSIPVEKTLTMGEGLTNAPDITGAYSFEISSATGAPLPEVKQVTNAEGVELVFGPISYTEVGTYTYTITETGSVQGVQNDGNKSVTVVVKDDGEGNLYIDTDNTTVSAANPVKFVNNYTVGTADIAFTAEKTLKVPEGLQGADITGLFTFTLAADSNNPGGYTMPTTLSLPNRAANGGSVTFDKITFTKPGEFKFTITEAGNVAYVQNDANLVREIIVTVVDNGNGTMTATSNVTNNTVSFENTYKVTPTSVTLPVEKSLTPEQEGLPLPNISGLFSFTITGKAVDAENNEIEGAVVPMPAVATLTYTEVDGVAQPMAFENISYSTEGTYIYTITESGSVNGVTNDEAKTVTVNVVDNGNGTLTATVTGLTDDKLTFENTYNVGPVEVTFPVVKMLEIPENSGLTGPETIKGEFTFTLSRDEANADAPMPETTSYINPDDNGGKVTFGPIKYTAPGEYKYIVTESGSVQGVTNDDTAAKTVTVNVTANNDGTMSYTVSSTEQNPLTFTNTYGVTPTNASFPVKKFLSVPAGLKAGSIKNSFTFTLTAAQGTPMPEETSYVNPDDDGGVVTFGAIEYSKPGTYTYTVTETGSADGVTNDATAAKTVTVEVVDNGNGTLTATASSTESAPLTFTNTYSADDATATFYVEKVLSVPAGLTPDSVAGQFTFTVTAADGVPMPEPVSQTNPDADGGVISFGPILYSAPGTYTYTVTESGEVDGFENDQTAAKTVTVTVADNGSGKLVATVSATEESPLVFTNEYSVEPTTASFPVNKIIVVPEGLTANSAAGKFTFTLSAADGVPMPAVTSYTNPTAQGGTVTFGEIEYTEPGTYTYTVTESGSVPGFTNDTEAARTVTVEVVDNGDGTMTATPSTATTPVTYTNTYGVKPTEISFPVEKILDVPAGLTAPDITGLFFFTLSVEEGTPRPDTIRYTNPEADGGTVTFGPISYSAPGTYTYTITEEGSADGVTNDATSTREVTVTVVDNGNGTLTATASTATAPAQFTNTYGVQPTEISIPVEKILTVPAGLTAGDITNKFTFTLTGVAVDAENNVIEGVTVPMPAVTSYQNPNANGGTVTFGDIEFAAPGTYLYTITETGSAPGVTNDATASKTVKVVVVDNVNGTLTATATGLTDGKITFENTYGVQPITASFPVVKQLDVPAGLNAPSIAGAFTFTVEAITAGAPMPSVTSQTNPDANGGTMVFSGMTYSMPGKYEYKVTETGSVLGVSNVTGTEQKVTVNVVDNKNGTLTATVSSTTESPLTFVNKYEVGKTTVSFPVKKEISKANSALTPADMTGKFTFTLTAADGTPMPETTEYTNPTADGGTVTFGTIEYTEPGTYTYTVTETGSAAGVTNDATAAKTVTVEVTDNGNGTMTAVASSTTDAPLTFTNGYAVTPTTASFPVEKVLDVPAGLTADDITGKFTFTLATTNGAPMPVVTSDVNPDADGGTVTFGDITYTLPGTYKYTVTESVTPGCNVDGITNDATATKEIIVTVVDNGNGTLTATPNSTASAPLTFTNIYGVEPTVASFPVKKELSVPAGLTADSIANKFTFTVTAATGTPMPAVTSDTNPDANGGVVTFGPISYSEPGIYTYTITETGSADGVTNDATSAKTVTVEVVDNGDGSLTARPSSTTANPLTFTNSYSVQPTTASFPVEKILSVPEGLTADSIANKFTFTLTAASGVPMPETTSYTNPDADGGVVTFGDITYTAPGTYTYTVTETGSAAGVTNDATAAKTVTVTVVDNGDGTLTATPSSDEQSPLTFTNEYNVEPTKASIPVKKVINVPAGLTAGNMTGKFTFTLTGSNNAPMPATTSYTNPSANGGTVTFGEITFTAPGTYNYTVTETGSADGITNDANASKPVTVTVVDNGDGSLTATVSSTSAAPLTFTNDYNVGSTTVAFPVKKSLSVPEGLTAGSIAGKFTFTLTAAEGTPMPETTSYTNPDANGGVVTFGNITYTAPGTYTYTVTETGSADGVTNDTTSAKTVTVTVVDNGDGSLTATASSTTAAPLTFTNSYNVQPTTGSFPVEKILDVPEGLTAGDITGKFTFTVTADEGVPMPATTSYTNPDADGGVVTFSGITYTAPGTYVYTVTETGSADGVTNDTTAAKTVTMTVVDNGDGTLTATADSTIANPLAFTNTYGVEPTTAKFPVKKTLTVPAGLSAGSIAGKFTFTLTAADGTPMPATTSYTNPAANGGTVTFGDITYTMPGTYTYTVTESGSAEGVVNDTTAAKTVTVTVVDNGDGTLTATPSSTASSPLTFTNEYKVGATSASFPVKKTLTVPEGLTAGDITGKFTFTLTAADGTPMPEVTSFTNPDADGGMVSFGAIEYTAPGTYTYTITETGSADGVTNDSTAAKTVTVTVVDNGDGTLSATASSTVESPLTFTNSYNVQPTTASFPVKKSLTVPEGLTADSIAGKFTFTLTADSGVPMPETTSYTNPDADGGVVTFGAISYNMPGTYTYTVTETGSADGVTNDATSAKTITVTVVDNGDGTLTATPSSTAQSPVTFTNTYNVQPTTASFPVKKTLEVPEGLTAGSIAGKFTFTLTAVDGAPMPATSSYTNPAANGGVVTFGAISYNMPGTYTYTVTETGSADGVTNDATSAKTVTVTVVDNGDGTLTATPSSTADSPLTFTNTYSVEGTTVSFPVEKVLEVPEGLTANSIAGKFTFTLTADSGVPMPETTAYTNPYADGGSVTFGPISYNAPGTYVYTVTETGSADGVTNDATSAKTVTVTVVDNGDGSLSATADSTVESKLTFTNTYSVQPTTASFPVEKILTVPEGLTADSIANKFTFTVTADAGVPMPATTSYTNPDADGGVVTFGDITYTAPGTYVYTITETGSADGVTNDATSAKTVTVTVVDNGNGTLTATADYTADSPLTFTNSYSVQPTTASFPVEKILTVPEGLTAGDITGKFGFVLAAVDGAPMPETTSYTNPDADGGSVSFGPISYSAPGTYAYTVTETGSADGVTNDATATKTVTVTVVDNGDGTLTATATSTSDVPLTFTNAYDVEPTTVSFPVEKVLEVPEGLAANSIANKFTFTLTADEGVPMPETTSYTNPDADGGVVTFGTIEYSEPGTYTYTVTETGSADGVTNDATSAKTVVVTVVDNGDGSLTATADSTTDSPLTFTNSYSVEPTTASFPVEKILTVPEGLTANSIANKFTFTLTAAQGTPMPETTSYTNPDADGGVVTFGTIEYTEPGTYTYTVTESGNADGVTNDATAAKTVIVTVVDNGNGTLTATADSTTDSPLTFTNTYSVEPITASFPVKKLLTKDDSSLNAPDISGKFTFTLTAEEGVPMPETTEYTNPDADGGEVTFGTIEYTMPGTYVYTITETGDVDGVVNDAEASKTVTVTVVDNGDGSLTATADSDVTNTLTFTNNYEVAPVTASIPMKKVVTKADESLTPADMTGKFTFTLSADDGVPMPETTEYTNPDADGGEVTFGTIEYTVPGTYVYTITETADVAGITNDAEPAKTVTVEVEDNGDGTMSIKVSSTEDNMLTFENAYSVEPIKVSFPVEKKLLVDEGDTAPDITGLFTFELTAAGDAPVPDTIRYTTPAANGGTVTFGDITITKPGNYVYTITETGTVTGIINDVEGSKTVTVDVVDNGDGTLTATLSSTADAPLTFTNSYEVVDINVLKVWDDDNNRDGYRPESIQVQLMANGTAKGEAVTLSDDNDWTYTWEELPRYATTKTDSQITYEVVEIVDELTADKYDIVVDAVWDEEANGNVTITNTHVPEVVEVAGAKTWADIDNKYLKRPDSVTIRLYEDGVEVASKQVTEADDWCWSFTDLPKYKIGQVGQEIVYTIDEDVVTGYIKTVDGYNVSNSLNMVEFIKLDEQTGKRLPGAKFALYEGRLGTYDETQPIETWTSTKDAKVLAGLKVGQTYTIVETFAPSGYAAMKPFQFTVELSDIPGTYRAFSASNCHVYRFRKVDSSNGTSVQGALMAIMLNGSVVHSWYSSGDNNGWFEIADHSMVAGLNYQLVELQSPWGYEMADPIPFTIDSADGMMIVNGHKTHSADLVMYDEPWPEVTPTPEPTSTSFTVTKIWEDKDNVLGLRPNSITVHLYRKLRTDNAYPTTPFMTVNIQNNGRDEWKFTFSDLPRRSPEGVLYEYCAMEDEVDGYVVAYRNNGKTIINSIPEEDFPPTPTPTLPYVTPTPTAMPRVPAGVQFIDGEWVYVDEYGIPLGGIPLTGDNTNFVLWGMAVGIPMLVAALAAVEIRRRKKLLLAAEDEEETETTEE